MVKPLAELSTLLNIKSGDEMTHTDVTEKTQELLDEFASQELETSVASCLVKFHQQDDRKLDNALIQRLKEITSSSHPPHYIEESTSGDKKDPEVRLNSQLRNGWQTGGGFRLPLDKVPFWDEYITYSRNVRYKIHSWVMLDSLLVVDSINEGREYLDLAVNIADDWIFNFVMSGKKDDFAWYDMAVGQRATKLAYMLRRLIEIDAPKNQIFRFILAAEIHFSELLEEERIAVHSNHGLFQMAGLLALCHNLPWMMKASEGIPFSERVLSKMIEEHFAKDGLHLEHSPDYHLYMVNHLQSLNNSGWLSSKFESMAKMIDSVVDAAGWMATPEHNVIPLGDTANNVKMTKRWAGYNGSLNTGAKFFSQGGLLIKNSEFENSIHQLIYSAQFHSRQHKHADHLNILYNLGEQPLLVDPGTFTYQYDIPERMYCEATRAHNCVEIDGLNYSRFRHDSFGSCMQFIAHAGKCTIAVGNVNHKRLISSEIPNNKIKSIDATPVEIGHRRTIVEYPGRFLAVIDELEAKANHEYISWFHFHPDLKIKAVNTTRTNVCDVDNNSLCQIQCYDLNSNSISSIDSAGQSDPILQGWYSKNGRELIPNATLGFPTMGQTQKWVTVFDFRMGKTGKPYLRSGTNGKYLRFALSQDDDKIDIRMKTGDDGNLTIDVEINTEPTAVEIVYDGVLG